jgi:hypothetical protein
MLDFLEGVSELWICYPLRLRDERNYHQDGEDI